ncbi:hypothetical protein [Kitasatospora sp. NPDC002040]|uniref:hypothetical protein n=1 Tax=Kitasatospora sp. NPDC002040 TaxID=3154661 RepID=UPI0033188DFA
MDIQVEYVATEEELAAALRANAGRHLVIRWVIVGAWGALALLGALGGLWVIAVPSVLLGAGQVWLITVGTGKVAGFAAKRFGGPTSVRLTDDGVSYTGGPVHHEFPWSSVTRVLNGPLAWALSSNQKDGRNPKGATLLKAHFTPEQRAELDAFLAARPGGTKAVPARSS